MSIVSALTVIATQKKKKKQKGAAYNFLFCRTDGIHFFFLSVSTESALANDV